MPETNPETESDVMPDTTPANATDATSPREPVPPEFPGLPPVFGWAVDTDSTRYALERPWVAGDWLYASDGRMAVRVPVSALPSATVDLYGQPVQQGLRRPVASIDQLFQGHGRRLAAGFYDADPTALPPVSTPYRPCPACRHLPSAVVPCSSCEGTGEIDCDECIGTGLVECDECEGDGKVTCEDCDGARFAEDTRVVLVRGGSDAGSDEPLSPVYLVAWLVGRLRRAGITEAWLPKQVETKLSGSSSMTVLNPVRIAFNAVVPGDGLGEGWVMPMDPRTIEHAREMGDDIDYPLSEAGITPAVSSPSATAGDPAGSGGGAA